MSYDGTSHTPICWFIGHRFLPGERKCDMCHRTIWYRRFIKKAKGV